MIEYLKFRKPSFTLRIRKIEMRRSGIYILAILGIVATSSGFTVERSNPEPFRSRNWSTPVLQLHRRASVANILNHEIRSADAANILRNSELREFVKLPDKKHSTLSENPQRIERSGDPWSPTNRSRIAEKITLKPKESTPGSSIVISSRDRTNSDPTFVPSTGHSKSLGSTIVTSQKETRTPDLSIVVGASAKKTKTSRVPISILSKETRSAESTIGTFSQETGNPGSTIASSEEMKSSELQRAHTGMEIEKRKKPSDKNTDVEVLKNVVFLLIDDSATGQGNYLRYFMDRHKFPVRGFLQNCNSVKIPEIVKFSLGDSLVSGKVDAECGCNSYLRANVGSLLSWARHVKEMTTGAVTTTNFSVPLPLDYESPANLLIKSFVDNDEISAVHQDIPRLKSESNEVWHLTDSAKQMVRDKRSVPSTSATPNIDIVPRQDAVNGFDGMWNVFDMFSRIRTAFFRILLESLGNMSASEDELGGKRPISSPPSLVGLVAETLREFQSVSNDNGFVLVAAAPEKELTDAADLLQRQFTTKDTLFVISGICSPTNEPVPFVAHGPGATSLHEARTMWDLPVLIKGAMIAACSAKRCKNERPEEPALPSLELHSLHDELLRNRFGRSATKEAAIKGAATKEAAIKEAATKDAANKDAGTKEAANKDAGTKDAGTKDAGTKDAGTKDAGTKDAGTKDAANKDAANKDAGTKDAATKDAANKDAANKDAANKDAGTKDAGTKDAATKDTASKDAANKDAANKDAANKDAATKDAATKDAANKDAANKDAGTKDAGTKDAGTKDAGTKDAATKDAATKDAANKDAANKDAGTKDAGTKDAGTKDAATKDTASKDAATKDAANKDAANKDTANKDTANKDAANKDAGTKDAGTKDATNKDGANKDAATKGAATKGAATEEVATEESAAKDAAAKGAAAKDAAAKDAAAKDAAPKNAAAKDAAAKEAVTKEVLTKEALTKNETITSTTTSTAKSTNVTVTESKNDTATSDIEPGSGAADIGNDNGAIIFGIITSAATLLALHSA